jgi:ATP-dependent Clp protease protease subunit
MKFWNLEPSQLADGTKMLDISLFGEIDPGVFADGVASKQIADQLSAHADAKEITVRINSVGGDLFGGMAIYNLLRGHGANVTTIVDGIAASAASIVAMAGRTVMNRGSMMMVHNPMTGVFGAAEDLRQSAEVLDKARDGLVAVYQAKTGMKPAALKKMLDAETWLTADEAKKQGFADEVADKPARAKAMAGGVIVNSIAFKREVLPAALQAMALPVDQHADQPVPDEHEPKEPGHEPEPDPQPEADKAQPDPLPPVAQDEPLTREKLDQIAPDLVKALLAEGRAEERFRLQAIDELGLEGCADLVIAAKYGDKPSDARDLAMAAVKARKSAGLDLLEARRIESKDAAGVRQSPPVKNTEAAEMQAAKNIAEHMNRRRGGVR